MSLKTFHHIVAANAELKKLGETIAQLEAAGRLPAGSKPNARTIPNSKMATAEIERRRGLIASAPSVAIAAPPAVGPLGTAPGKPAQKTEGSAATAQDTALWREYFRLQTASERAAFYEANSTALSQANERLEEARKSQTQTSWSRNFLGSQNDPETIAERDRRREEARDPLAQAWSRPFLKR